MEGVLGGRIGVNCFMKGLTSNFLLASYSFTQMN